MPVTIQGSGQVPVQVQSTTKTNTFVSATTTSTWIDITGLSVNITPTNSANKIKITVMLTTGGGGNNYSRGFRVTRNGTTVSAGDAGTGISAMGSYHVSDNGGSASISIVAVDSPATTSSITYQVQLINPPSSVTGCYINRPYNTDGNAMLCISTITVEEIAYA
jgi:hypothetical protein